MSVSQPRAHRLVPPGVRPSMISEKQQMCHGIQRVNGDADPLGPADPALTLRVYAHAMRNEEADLSFAEFSDPRRPLAARGRPRTPDRQVRTLARVLCWNAALLPGVDGQEQLQVL